MDPKITIWESHHSSAVQKLSFAGALRIIPPANSLHARLVKGRDKKLYKPKEFAYRSQQIRDLYNAPLATTE